jgi:glycerophosphoryl diester phosphodiesterase
MATFSLPFLLALLTYVIMEKGCLPCSGTPGFTTETTPTKPLLIGHRGCLVDAPENTVAAFERAVVLPTVVGLETDIFVSMDGVLFLLHDPHLVRTTDVRVTCPTHRAWTNSTQLYYHNGSCPLGKLNAGASFVRSRKGEVSIQDMPLFEGQHIPTFRQFLDVAVREGKIIIFDVNEPPVGHPYHHTYLNKTIAEILAAGVPPHKVWRREGRG